MAGCGETTSPIFRLVQRLNDDAVLCVDQAGVVEDARFLADTCPMIEAVLGDAEERQIHDTSTKLWLRSLKYLAADMEDLMEEYEYHNLHMGTMESVNEKEKHMQAAFLDEWTEKVRMIRQTYDEINKLRAEELQSRENDGDRHLKTPIERQVGHFANESIMYGRDDDQKHLVDLLKNEYVSVVISLVGIGGIGKTTLAQALYNDVEIDKYFDCKAWVAISEEFDILQITKNLLESLTRKASDLINLCIIQEELQSQLQGKKFFFVLNDVWDEKALYHLEFLLYMGSVGSKILITTRIMPVAKALSPSVVVHELKPLLEEDGWELFCRHAFGGKVKTVWCQI